MVHRSREGKSSVEAVSSTAQALGRQVTEQKLDMGRAAVAALLEMIGEDRARDGLRDTRMRAPSAPVQRRGARRLRPR